MKLSTSDIIAIVSILVSVLLGGGWLTSYLAAKKQYKNGFLIPLQTTLSQNKKIHKELTKDIDLEALEYAPDYIQQKFNELDHSNPTKQMWMLRIETLLDNNEMAIKLITPNIGSVKNKKLKKELEIFLFHAQKFNDIWKMISSDKPIGPGIDPHTDLMGEKYPANLDSLLQREIGNN